MKRSIIWQFHQLVWLLLITVIQLSHSARLFVSRKNAMAQLTGVTEESQLFFSHCDQSSYKASRLSRSCRLAIDNDTTTVWTQCAHGYSFGAFSEEHAWWKGVLKNPSYVTTVKIINANWQNVGSVDALRDFSLVGNDYFCYTHTGGESFANKTIQCDMMADEIEIQARQSGTVLALCDVQVFGTILQVDFERKESPQVIPENCDQSSTNGTWNCDNAFDNYKSNLPESNSCAVTETDPNPAWWRASFTVPAIVREVALFNRGDNGYEDLSKYATVYIGGRLCNTRANQNGGELSRDPTSFDSIYNLRLSCNHFGGVIFVEMRQSLVPLVICEILIAGYRVRASPESRRNQIGCFADKPDDPDLSHLASITRMHVDKCDRICRRLKKKYIGLQWGMECWCGDSHGKHGIVEDSSGNCSIPCEGKKGEKLCGGQFKNLVFELM